MIRKLRERVRIERPVETRDDTGASIQSWQVLATVWADVTPLNGREALMAMQMEDRQSHRVTIRYRTDVTAKMRMIWREETLNIRALRNKDKRRRFLEIDVEQGVAV